MRASKKAITDALWRNSIHAAEVFGFVKSDMLIDVAVGIEAFVDINENKWQLRG